MECTLSFMLLCFIYSYCLCIVGLVSIEEAFRSKFLVKVYLPYYYSPARKLSERLQEKLFAGSFLS